MSSPARRVWLGWLLRLLGPVILVLLLSRLDDPGEVWRIFSGARPGPLAVALALNVVPLWLKVVRWQVILRTRGIHYATRPALLGFSASLYLGMLTPGRVGDVLRIHYLRHDTGARYAEGLAFLVVDRLADLWIIAGFTSYAVLRWSDHLPPDLAHLGWIMIAGSLLAPAPLFIPRLAEKLLGRIYQRMAREKEADGLTVFLETLRASARRSIVPVIGLTLLAYSVNFLQGSILAGALDIELGVIDAACLQSVQGLLGLLPISVSGLGVREALFAAIFPKLGAPEAGFTAAGGASYGLLVFLVMYVAQVLIGAVAWQIRPPLGRRFAPEARLSYGRAAPMQSSRTSSSPTESSLAPGSPEGDGDAATRRPIVAEVVRAEEEVEGDDAPSSDDGALVARRDAPISRPASSARGAVRASSGLGPRISIVIPALNESESLPELEQRIREALTGKEDYEIIFVDDGSTDDTWKCIGRMVDASPHVRGVKLRKNFGKAMGLTAGFSRARGDIVIMMDADLQDDPAELPKFIEKVDEGFDVVVGWKVKRLDPANRLILTRIFNGTVRWVTGVKLHDMNCGFKAYSRDVIRTVPIYGDLFRFIPALAAWEGFRVTEVPVHHHSRKHGVSRYGLERIMRGSFDLLTIAFLTKYSRRPMHLFGLFGALLGFVGFVINLYLTVLWFRGESIGHRPLLLLGSTLFLAGLQFISVGVLGEFLTYLHQKRIRPTDLPIREEVDATSGLHRPGRSTLG